MAKPNRFITFTCRPATAPTPREAYDFTRRKLCDLHKLIRKHHGSFDYLRVLEVHRNGYPHYHYVARCKYIPQSFLSTAWKAATGNFIVDIRAVDKRTNVFRYVMKYLAKQTLIPWTNRRVAVSRGFFPPDPEKARRQNPFISRRRKPMHPADWISEHWTGEHVLNPRPGVWIIDRDD